jgi:predicted protein tyrosine phosphatase
MDEIRPWLYIGKYRDTIDRAYLQAQAINAILELAEDVKQPNIISLYLPVEDVAPIPFDLMHKGVTFVREQKALGHRVLVACGAGINRSSAFCTAALKEEERLGLLEAFKEVKRHHHESEPHQPIWESLCEYYGESIPYTKISLL